MKLRSAQEQERKNVSEEKVFSLLRSQRLTRKKFLQTKSTAGRGWNMIPFWILSYNWNCYKNLWTLRKKEETVNTKTISLHSGEKKTLECLLPSISTPFKDATQFIELESQQILGGQKCSVQWLAQYHFKLFNTCIPVCYNYTGILVQEPRN